VAVIILWWCFWLWVANFRLTGLLAPGPRTQAMVLIMLASVFLGSLFVFTKTRPSAAVAKSNVNIRHNGRYLLWLNILYLTIVAFLLVRALPLLLSGDPVEYRAAAFGSLDAPSPVFGGGYLQFLFELLILPVIFISLVIGLILYFRYRRKALLLLSLILMTMEAALMLGRFNFFYMVVLAPLTYILTGQRRPPEPGVPAAAGQPETAKTPGRSKTMMIMAVGLLLALVTLLAVSVLRGKKNVDFMTLFRKTIVEYHTVGFVLFDQELSVPTSRLNTRMSYGRSVLGGLDTLVAVFLRRVNPDLVPMAGENGAHMAVPREVGNDEMGEPVLANAFYTVLYSLYFDGRYLAVILIPFVFGIFLGRSYLDWLKNGSLAGLALLLVLMYAGIFSLFQSPAESLRFWGSLLLLALAKKANLDFLTSRSPAPNP
jgi:oligosaccharide repeat unit polymerase